jgi:hypothetical protein
MLFDEPTMSYARAIIHAHIDLVFMTGRTKLSNGSALLIVTKISAYFCPSSEFTTYM